MTLMWQCNEKKRIKNHKQIFIEIEFTVDFTQEKYRMKF